MPACLAHLLSRPMLLPAVFAAFLGTEIEKATTGGEPCSIARRVAAQQPPWRPGLPSSLGGPWLCT